MYWVWILLVPAAALLGVSVGLYAGTALLRRTVRELTYALAELEDRFIRHVKRGAALERWDAGPDQETAKEEVKAGFLHPAEFARRKSERRMRRGAETGQGTQENSG